uniref:Probable xyloglucan endotransglucosylase/hydrolase protein 26 n=1 Tax=Tanacetum cinerariifolium TaxID=118510 RepID=A0A699JD69_TANCI|nr:probable xyloglucan endotransglucosylase/hydrolase protein 26 [Tanacetum cinerariifolium]
MAGSRALFMVVFVCAVAFHSSMVNANFPKSMYFNWGAQHSSILGKGDDLRLVLDQTSDGMLIVFQSESLETIKVNGLHTKTNKGCSELELVSGTDLLASASDPFHPKPTGGHLLFTSN